jgi:hypothetical protein
MFILTTAKLDFTACFRYAKCSFRVRLRKKLFNRSVGVKVAFFRQEFEKKMFPCHVSAVIQGKFIVFVEPIRRQFSSGQVCV